MFFDVQTVEQLGRVVVVTAPVTNIGTTQPVLDLVIRRDTLFLNR